MTERLKEQIEQLEALHTRLGQVRQVPPALLQMRTSTGDEFRVVKEIGEVVMSEPVQAALHQARESLERDGASGIGTEVRRENRKRRRAPSPENYTEERRTPTVLLPRRPEPAVPLGELGAWARAWNETHATAKMRIKGRVVRLALADVMTVYMGVGVGRAGEVVVETIRAFGPREGGGGRGESKYEVYGTVSQQLGRGLEGGDGGDGLGTVAGHVLAYADLFVRRCGVCGRVVSHEGHVPCVVRWWDGRTWAGAHAGCDK
ncbi:hypothetical protein BDN70DRAFT_928340 [Pholiota conissans]|uniref:Uncharacterized protein n=1 Tax=Pholiota conissans TaxID=109636 RepID=A0A9P6D5F2_9AGAR|nr:hypothetical protein BDN70DRAFT_928340 [Pholiota conissans]